MSNKKLAGKGEKFLFNVNNFDAPDEDEHEEDVYVAPTFSEEELEAAKKQAFEDGKQAGIAESKASRDQHVANILNKIADIYPAILAQEEERAKLYELEAVRLSLAIFDKLYPVLRDHFAQDELQTHLQDVIAHQSGDSAMTITVHPDVEPRLKALMERAIPHKGKGVNFEIETLESTDIQSFEMSWTNGGALYNGEKLAQEIRTRLEEALAPFPANSHDGEDTQNTPSASQSDEDAQEGAIEDE